jgi:hypothetical protein
MPAVAENEDTRKVTRMELAEMLNRSGDAISRAAHKKFFCNGWPIFEWAEWHPRGNQIRFYRVPVHVLRDLVPPSEYDRWGL